MSPEQVLTEAEIRSLLIRERFYRDAGEWQKLRGCYHPDASLTLIDITWYVRCEEKDIPFPIHVNESILRRDLARYKGDADGFVRRSEEMAAAGSQAIHTIQPVEIEVNGSKGFAQSVGTIATRFERDGNQYDMVSKCRMLSRLMQVQSADSTQKNWYMVSMEVIYLQDSILPVLPEAFSSDQEFVRAMSKKRKSYALLSMILEAKGFAINDKLPGSDDKDSVDTVLETNRRWLSS